MIFKEWKSDVGFMMMGVLMSDINNITLSGRLVRDSLLFYSSTNLAILNFSIANNIKVKRKGEWRDNAQFFNCVLFGKLAETLIHFLSKGKQVVVHGSMRHEYYKDKHSGVDKIKSIIFVDQLRLFDSDSKHYNPKVDIPIPVPACEFNEDIPF
ncbi:single-stranded DNA-binding protein [Borrelia duttonii]|uniref:Single-stranded DNA-binding protein n=1 Tax=Borrelia duttonii (strain Ly) TaxID=412419 RepID=B5RP33_BORDL|nr:single-stranded DNA-binding protein [Borrelia duttonii Ly]